MAKRMQGRSPLHILNRTTSLVGGLVALAISVTANALIISASTWSYGELINLDLSRTITDANGGTTVAHATVNSGPLPSNVGTSPGPFDISLDAASISVIDNENFGSLTGNFMSLTTGPLHTRNTSDIDGLPGDRFTQGLTNVGAVRSPGAVALGVFGDFFVFTADLISVGAITGTEFGNLTTGGVTELFNASIDMRGFFHAALPIGPTANTHVSLINDPSLSAISLVLNEQIITGDGVSTIGLAVNGLHLRFDNYLVDATENMTLNGDIILGHTEGQIRVQADALAVPEPDSLSLVGLALAGLAFSRRKSSNWLHAETAPFRRRFLA